MSAEHKPHSTQHAFQVIRECLAQGQRAMDELCWTQRDVMVQATLTRLEEQLEAAQHQADENRQIIESERDYIRQLKEQLDAAQDALRAIKSLPSDHDLMHNAIAKAAFVIADKALDSNPASTPKEDA